QFVTNPDTCARITSIAIDSSAVSFVTDGRVNGYRATWQSSFDPNRWEIEYGEAGFQSGAGHSDIVESAYCIFTPLQPSTDYELRVRTICNNDVYGEWSSVLFRTATPEPEAIQNTKADIQLTVSPNPANGKCLVTLGDNPEAELRLYSADGSLIQTINSTTPSVLLNLTNPGIFLLQVTTPSGTTTRKIVNR
nr:T9SS type A sorting domain-containing protein [Bacteroidales bacterium]